MQDIAYQKLRSMFSTKQCTHFNPSFATRQVHSQKPAILFLKLRNSGCNRHHALHFCKKPHCKNDITKSVDGPQGCRVLKRKVSCKTVHENGWIATEPQYKMEKQYFLSSKDVLLVEEEPEKEIQKQQQLLKSEYNKKIQAFTDYYSEIQGEHNYSELSEKKLLKKIKRLNKEKDNEIHESADELLKGNPLPLPRNDITHKLLPNKQYQNNLITELEVFPKMVHFQT